MRQEFNSPDEAREKAIEIGQAVKFECFTEGVKDFHGTALPCGCIHFQTVLTDGSLGWGEWEDECWDCMRSDNIPF